MQGCESDSRRTPGLRRRARSVAFALALMLVGGASAAHAQTPLAPQPLTPQFSAPLVPTINLSTPYVDDEVLVRFAPGTDASEQAQARRDEGATLEKKLPLSGLQLVKIDPNTT